MPMLFDMKNKKVLIQYPKTEMLYAYRFDEIDCILIRPAKANMKSVFLLTKTRNELPIRTSSAEEVEQRARDLAKNLEKPILTTAPDGSLKPFN